MNGNIELEMMTINRSELTIDPLFIGANQELANIQQISCGNLSVEKILKEMVVEEKGILKELWRKAPLQASLLNSIYKFDTNSYMVSTLMEFSITTPNKFLTLYNLCYGNIANMVKLFIACHIGLVNSESIEYVTNDTKLLNENRTQESLDEFEQGFAWLDQLGYKGV